MVHIIFWSLVAPDRSLRETDLAISGKTLVQIVTAAEAISGSSATVVNEVCSHKQFRGDGNQAFWISTNAYISDVAFDIYRKKTTIKNADGSPKILKINISDSSGENEFS